MKASKRKSVNMTYRALYSYVLNTNYRSFSGISGLFISVLALVYVAVRWNNMLSNQRFGFLFVGILFTVVNPLMLAFRTFRQLKLSPSYKNPLDYTFSDTGIIVEQGELKEEISWDRICRILLTDSMFAIYTSRVHAFVIPLDELGEDKGKIITAVVQFTSDNKPVINGRLKRYQSGKGYNS